jgi:DNA-binding transcriptional MerR regulator
VTVDNATVTVNNRLVARDDERYGIDALADLGGVSRRTVRYYIQEGLLPAPFGVGRGDHYGPDHLNALLRIKALQEAGRTLDEIRRPASKRDRVVQPAAAVPSVEPWRRIELAPGIELHVSGARRLPSAAAVRVLTDWCRTHLAGGEETDDAGT